ncbi:MAG: hypothetical protein ACNA8H_12020 [Anaerolineales bacterium]
MTHQKHPISNRNGSIGQDEPGYLHAPLFNYRDPFFDPALVLGDDLDDSDNHGYEYMPTTEELEQMRREEYAEWLREQYEEELEEEESLSAQRADFISWSSDYTDAWGASEEGGWFYSDDY